MKAARRVPMEIWDFVVGEDWRLALAAVIAIGGAAALVGIGVNAWWWVPLALAVSLWAAVRP
ncbi:MAG TPA: hypothetical protein VHA76_10435 [Solirubrobacterales bacterium]|nr:hypothetical protein [Solirubrobacterales bacterium]